MDNIACEKILIQYGDYIFHTKKDYGKIVISVNIGYKIVHAFVTIFPEGLKLKDKDTIFPDFESIKKRYTYLINDMIMYI